MPAGYPIANNLVTDNPRMALSAPMGKKLALMSRRNTLFVVAADAPDEDKLVADYQCTGDHDELVIQSAVNEVFARKGGTILLSRGTFYIDSFPNYESADDGGSYTAILIPSDDNIGYKIGIIGEQPYVGKSGTIIRVSNTCYEGLNQNKRYKIFRTRWSSSLISKAKVALKIGSLDIRLPYNQKPIMCIDLRSCNRVWLENIMCVAFTEGYGGYSSAGGNPPAVAVEGCVGIRMTSGSNSGLWNNYYSSACVGFYEGWQVGGEHVIGINLGGHFNVYTYTFGNYPWTEAFHHPITLINCSDERSVNMPLFAYCGANKNNGEGGQEITLIDFNFERYAPQTPGGVLGESAMEIKPGTFHGEITYTTQRAGSNVGDIPFWKNGHGTRFITRNSAHRRACDTTTRNSYAPNYLQRIWDTTLNKEVICTNTATKEWRDTAGNIV